MFFNSQRRRAGVDSSVSNMNEDWKHMFGSGSSKSPSDKTKKSEKADEQTLSLPPAPLQQSVDSQYEHISPARVEASGDIVPAPCNLLRTSLIQRRAALYKSDAMRDDAHLFLDNDHRPAPAGWRPRGVLVAHLHEHRTAVNRIRVRSFA